MSLAKNFNFTERVKAQFRFDAYNVFNHPVLGFSSTQGNLCVDCTGRDPGRVQDIEGDASPNAPNGMRQLQFGLHILVLTERNFAKSDRRRGALGLLVFFLVRLY